ncbi:MAG: 8-amino-7-oxononanoate synthase [Alphaproteobacteria bacterium]|nr:8-amino-7-oxononanoate synthase [Alphaproteobacteria bacterium]
MAGEGGSVLQLLFPKGCGIHGLVEDPHKTVLETLAAKGRLRELNPSRGLDFTSNDFLALAESRALRDAASEALARGVPLGAGGSRLLRGNHPEHEALEEEAASFFGSETALYFPTGFAANAALAATLPRPGDLIVYDALIHASLRDGLEPARIQAISAPHNDVDAMETIIKGWRASGGKGRVWIAVETLYSMDGDRAPLPELVALATRHDAMLLLDEAHATGVHGDQGRGLGARYEGAPNIISLHTCGKALGASGALVCLPRLYRDFLVNRGRAFIYSTAPSPLMAAVVRASLRICAGAEQERAQLAALVRHAGEGLAQLGITPSGTQIQPVIVGEDARAVALAATLQERGHDIRAIRPPTVPEGTARLRIALTLHVTQDDLDKLLADLAFELARL